MDLALRPWTEDDAPALSAAIEASLEHLRPWMAWAVEEPHDDAWRRGWIREANEGPDVILGMWLDGAVVGGCGLHGRIGPDGREIGYWVHVAYVRRGIATQAVRMLRELAFAEPEVVRVEIHHDRANVASGRVAAAAGFTLVEERLDGPATPCEEGVEMIWRSLRAR